MKIIKKTCIRQPPAIALCTLGSINWGAFRHPSELKRVCKLIVRGLDNLLSYQDFLSIQSKMSNEDFRPLGVGITNLAYFFAKRNLKYGEPDTLAEVKIWAEHQVYYLTEATVELAKERGPCKKSHLTRYGQGIFPWELRAEGVNELTDFTPEKNWETLRADMIKYGVRNATNSAFPPVESCQSWRNTLNFSNGDRLNFHELLDSQGINWKDIELNYDAGTAVALNTAIAIAGRYENEIVDTVIYNGLKPVNTITFDDGTQLNFTDNHRLLVDIAGNEEWIFVSELADSDEIVVGATNTTMKIKSIVKHSHEEHTWDISTPSHTFLLPNNCVSHNSSVVVNSTNGFEMPLSLIQIKDSKSGSLIQVVPDYLKLKNKYQLMWDQTDCLPYIKTAAVLSAYVDQGMSTNTFYNPKYFPDKKVPATLMANNLMLGAYYGLKSFYYNRLPKVVDVVDEPECTACIL